MNNKYQLYPRVCFQGTPKKDSTIEMLSSSNNSGATKNTGKQHKTMVFRHWPSGSTGTPREGNKWSKSYDFPRVLPRDRFQLYCRNEEPRWSLGVTLSWRDGAGGPRRSRWLELAKQSTGDWKAVLRGCSRDLQGSESPHMSSDQNMWCEETPRPPKGTEGRILRAYTGLGIVFPPTRVENLVIPGASGRVLSRVLSW